MIGDGHDARAWMDSYFAVVFGDVEFWIFVSDVTVCNEIDVSNGDVVEKFCAHIVEGAYANVAGVVADVERKYRCISRTIGKSFNVGFSVDAYSYDPTESKCT